MSAPALVPIDASRPATFVMREEAPVVAAYTFWLKRPNDTVWLRTDAATIDDTPWTVDAPLPPGTRFAYSFTVSGRPRSPWRVRLTITQPGGAGDAGSWTEQGETDAGGEFTLVDPVILELT